MMFSMCYAKIVLSLTIHILGQLIERIMTETAQDLESSIR